MKNNSAISFDFARDRTSDTQMKMHTSSRTRQLFNSETFAVRKTTHKLLTDKYMRVRENVIRMNYRKFPSFELRVKTSFRDRFFRTSREKTSRCSINSLYVNVRFVFLRFTDYQKRLESFKSHIRLHVENCKFNSYIFALKKKASTCKKNNTLEGTRNLPMLVFRVNFILWPVH